MEKEVVKVCSDTYMEMISKMKASCRPHNVNAMLAVSRFNELAMQGKATDSMIHAILSDSPIQPPPTPAVSTPNKGILGPEASYTPPPPTTTAMKKAAIPVGSATISVSSESGEKEKKPPVVIVEETDPPVDSSTALMQGLGATTNIDIDKISTEELKNVEEGEGKKESSNKAEIDFDDI